MQESQSSLCQKSCLYDEDFAKYAFLAFWRSQLHQANQKIFPTNNGDNSSGDYHKQVLKKMIMQIQKMPMSKVFEIYFGSQKSQAKFLDFLETQLPREVEKNRGKHILNFATLMLIKCIRNPGYDIESAVQCLDFAPLTNQQLRQSLNQLKNSFVEWTQTKKQHSTLEKNEPIIFLKKRRYETIKTLPSTNLEALLDHDFNKVIRSRIAVPK